MPAQPSATATAALSSTSSTRAALVKRVLRRLNDDPMTDTHSNSFTAGGTSLTVATDATTRYESGDTLDWLEDGTFDAALVTAVAATTLTIRDGHRGTTAANHSANAIFRKNPRWLSHTIGEYVDEAVDMLWPHLYTVYQATYTVEATDTDFWYSLPSNSEQVLEVYQVDTDAPETLVKPLRFSLPTWRHAGFAANNKAVYIDIPDSTISTMYLIYTAKPLVTELTSAMQNIVVLDAARSALESEGAQLQRQGGSFVFDVPTKVEQWRRQADRMRELERRRLDEYLPSRSRLIFNGSITHTSSSISSWR